MFFRDRTNMTVLAFYVVACVCGVMVAQRVAPRQNGSTFVAKRGESPL